MTEFSRVATSRTVARPSSKETACTVAVIGAGPYGLAVASRLRESGVEARVFGEVMSFWRDNMPEGMLLRSEWAGSHIGELHGPHTLDRYEAAHGIRLPRRIPLPDFIAYGRWYQQQAAPNVDPRQVARVTAQGKGFGLILEDGEAVFANRVVVATGLTSFAARPPAFDFVPPELAPHSCDVRDVAAYAGLKVAVIGAGQSALELSALLHEAGAVVEVLARADEVRWLSGRERLRRYSGPLRKLIYPPGEVGPPGINWIVQFPDLFRQVPSDMRAKMARRAIRPAGSGWVRPRLDGVPITAGRAVAAAEPSGSGLRLTLDDGSRRDVDRVVLATGYRVDLDRSAILAPELAGAISRIGGYPRLAPGFESSVPGLHFVGAAAAESFGPLMRFVAGSGYAARSVARRVTASLAGAGR
jgi:FAD-dependent urate hydroxylase